MKKENNYAFIDSQNLNLAIRSLGWKINFTRLRIYLREKYAIQKAYLFIGYLEGNTSLYTSLQDAGFILVFKPTLKYKDGTTKGNCDAELVLHAMVEYQNYQKAVIITGDGDFHCLVEYLEKQNKLKKLLIPNQSRYSALLKTFDSEFVAFMSDLKKKLEYKRKEPHEDGTS